jgi:hypothetical protein
VPFWGEVWPTGDQFGLCRLRLMPLRNQDHTVKPHSKHLHPCIFQTSEECCLLGLVESSSVVQIRAPERVGCGRVCRESGEDT